MWKTVKLKDICSVFSDGDWIETKHQSLDGIRLIQTGNVKIGNFADREDKARYISEETFRQLNCTAVREGDLLVSRLPEPVGRACIIPKLKAKAITAVDCTIIRTREFVLPTFLNYYMQSPRYFSAVQEKVTGATRQRISRKNLGEIDIQVPPLAEQQRIVAKLDEAFADIDKAIDIKNRKLENTNQLAERVLTTVFNSNLACSDSTLGDYYDVRDGTHDSPKYVDEGFPLVTSKNLKSGKLDLENVKFISEEDYEAINKRSSVKVGDVLMAMIGTIGNPIVITETPRYSIKNVALFKTNSTQNPFYLKYFLELPSTKSKMLRDAKGTTQKFVGLGYLRKFPICVPNIDVQNRIVEQIDSSLSKINYVEDKMKKSIDELGALKTSILAQELQPPRTDVA